MDDELAAIRDTFFQECEDQLSELETGLMALQRGAGDRETVNAVFRAVHSIKGGAGAFGLDALVRFAHQFEAALDHLRSGRLQADAAIMAVLLRAADGLTDLVHTRGGGSSEAARNEALEAELADINRHAAPGKGTAPALGTLPPPVAAPANQVWTIRFTPLAALYAHANEALVLLGVLRSLGEIEVSLDASRLPDLASLDPEGAYLDWTIRLRGDCDEAAIRAVFEFAEDDCTLQIVPPGIDDPLQRAIAMAGTAYEDSGPSDADIAALINAARAAVMDLPEPGPAAPPAPQAARAQAAQLQAAQLQAAQAPTAQTPTAQTPTAQTPIAQTTGVQAPGQGATIRVDLDRVDRMIDLVGELVINGSMLSQRVMEAGLAAASVEAALDDLGRITREIQDSVMAIRAQPVRSVFQRMPRLVREVAGMTGKQVRLVTEGEATEVDKTVIERIVDPLTHMIRNAIDHGLESPDRRASAGKPAEGVVKLAALHRSGRIVILVEDDGGGIDRDRVRAKAIQNGVIGPDAQLTDEEIDNLIFLPGFSTAATVSDISGRGVGMDVVRRSVQALGGRISIASRPGRGSTFTLSLPLTLAVLDGMVVTVAGHTLIVPLTAMVEAMRPQPGTIQQLGPDASVAMLRGGCVPLIDVARALGYREAAAEPDASVAVLVEGGSSARALLMVDTIQGQRQVVIKSLEANYRAVPGIAAATVMGDGKVALILDVDKIITLHADAASEPRLALAS
jgi:two-component system chemotaxis sensor kinase CheA